MSCARGYKPNAFTLGIHRAFCVNNTTRRTQIGINDTAKRHSLGSSRLRTGGCHRQAFQKETSICSPYLYLLSDVAVRAVEHDPFPRIPRRAMVRVDQEQSPGNRQKSLRRCFQIATPVSLRVRQLATLSPRLCAEEVAASLRKRPSGFVNEGVDAVHGDA